MLPDPKWERCTFKAAPPAFLAKAQLARYLLPLSDATSGITKPLPQCDSVRPGHRPQQQQPKLQRILESSGPNEPRSRMYRGLCSVRRTRKATGAINIAPSATVVGFHSTNRPARRLPPRPPSQGSCCPTRQPPQARPTPIGYPMPSGPISLRHAHRSVALLPAPPVHRFRSHRCSPASSPAHFGSLPGGHLRPCSSSLPCFA